MQVNYIHPLTFGMTVPLFIKKCYRMKGRLFQQNLTFDHLYLLKTKSRKIIPNVARQIISICIEKAYLLINRPNSRFTEISQNDHVTCHVKAWQDVEFYNQGKVQLGKTNITRDIAVQPYFYFTFLTQALNCLSCCANSINVYMFTLKRQIQILPKVLTRFLQLANLCVPEQVTQLTVYYLTPLYKGRNSFHHGLNDFMQPIIQEAKELLRPLANVQNLSRNGSPIQLCAHFSISRANLTLIEVVLSSTLSFPLHRFLYMR